MYSRVIDFLVELLKPLLVILTILFLTSVIIILDYTSFKTPGSGPEEIGMLQVSSINDLLQNALFLPQRLLQFVFSNFEVNETVALKMPSVLMASIAAILMFYVLRHWYSKRVALLGTLLFASSSWFLLQARSASFGISLILSAMTIISLGIWASERKRVTLLPLVGFICGLLLYVPGGWLFLIIALVAGNRELKFIWKKNSKLNKVLSISLFILSIVPLLYSLYINHNQLDLLGVSSSASLQTLISNIINLPGQLFISGLDNNYTWLAGTPILDMATTILLILALYGYRSGYNPVRFRGISVATGVSLLLIGTYGVSSISWLVPFLYLFIAAGIALLLQMWFSVFPKNPIAKYVGLLWIGLLVVLIAYYQGTRYFVGYSHNRNQSNIQVVN